MPTNYIKSLHEKTGRSIESLEKDWDKAKGIAEGEGRKDDYAYTTGIFKRLADVANTEFAANTELAAVFRTLKIEVPTDFRETYPNLWYLIPDSTAIKTLAYDVDAESLYVAFKSSSGAKLYEYQQVPLKIWLALTRADSKGSFIASRVRGKYLVIDHS